MLLVDVEKQLGDFRLTVSFTSNGLVTGLFGNSGAGKTSIINMIAGLIAPDRGRIALDEQDLDNTLLHVYRELSDPELEQFVEFAQSADGQAYYQAALQALRAGLAVGMSTDELEPAPQGI